MEIIKTFKENNVRILIINKEPFFAATDICTVLNIKNSRQALTYLDKDDVISNDAVDRLGKRQTINYVNESGLYQLIFRSRKKEALKFKKWVTNEVLPSIRKTGKYSIPEHLKKKSTEHRNVLTSEWAKHGISKPNEYMRLTVKEYKELNIADGKRKKDFSEGEILLLSALESMESLKLFYDDSISGISDCAESIEHTAKKVKTIVNENKYLGVKP